jgi:hypothetical protein
MLQITNPLDLIEAHVVAPAAAISDGRPGDAESTIAGNAVMLSPYGR